jgi:transposase
LLNLERIQFSADIPCKGKAASSGKFRERVAMSANKTGNGPRWSGRRARAARMLAAGMGIARVASALGLSPLTARRYERAFAMGGADALTGLGDVGRRSRLSAGALATLTEAVRRPPAAAGFADECWTGALVRLFIEREFQITYSSSHINRLIRDHGLQHWIGPSRKPVLHHATGAHAGRRAEQ